MKTSESKYAQCIYFASAALARKVEKLATESWKKVDLSPSHAYLLIAVLEEPGIQPMALSQHLQLTPSTITRLIEKLEQKRLVVRTTEGKTTNVYPTPKGRDLQPKLLSCMEDFNSTSAAIFGKEESYKLVRSLASFADKLNS